jgi:hypothetical protein
MPEIEYAPGAEDAPLTGLLAELIEANLEEKPERIKDFNRLNIRVGIDATDANSRITLEFRTGKLVTHNGLADPAMVIRAEIETLLLVTNLNIKFGIPWYFDKTGLEVIRKLLKGELAIKGMLRHPIALTRITKIMSVE